MQSQAHFSWSLHLLRGGSRHCSPGNAICAEAGTITKPRTSVAQAPRNNPQNRAAMILTLNCRSNGTQIPNSTLHCSENNVGRRFCSEAAVHCLSRREAAVLTQLTRRKAAAADIKITASRL